MPFLVVQNPLPSVQRLSAQKNENKTITKSQALLVALQAMSCGLYEKPHDLNPITLPGLGSQLLESKNGKLYPSVAT